VEELERIVGRIRARWPEVRILIRADSGCAREQILAWCEAKGVDYVIGLARNGRLQAALAREMAEAEARCKRTGEPARVFKDVGYRTLDSWSRALRVVGKAEALPGKANPRFVVTSLARSTLAARALYEDLYCARGEMENRIKEQQLGMFADRTSTATMRGEPAALVDRLARLRARAGAAPGEAARHAAGTGAGRDDPHAAAQDRGDRAGQRTSVLSLAQQRLSAAVFEQALRQIQQAYPRRT
jgi:hypothetical protein